MLSLAQHLPHLPHLPHMPLRLLVLLMSGQPLIRILYIGKRILGGRIGEELPEIDGVRHCTDPTLANICVRGGGFGGSFPRLRECAAAPVSWHRLKHVWMGEASGNALRD